MKKTRGCASASVSAFLRERRDFWSPHWRLRGKSKQLSISLISFFFSCLSKAKKTPKIRNFFKKKIFNQTNTNHHQILTISPSVPVSTSVLPILLLLLLLQSLSQIPNFSVQFFLLSFYSWRIRILILIVVFFFLYSVFSIYLMGNPWFLSLYSTKKASLFLYLSDCCIVLNSNTKQND